MNLKLVFKTTITAIILSLLLLPLKTLAQVSTSPDDMIEVGLGGAQAGDRTQFLVEIEYRSKKLDLTTYPYSNRYFVIVSAKASATSDGKGIDGADMRVDFLTRGFISTNRYDNKIALKGDAGAFFESSLFSLNYSRNTMLDVDSSVRFTILGIRTGGEAKFTDELSVFAILALDVLSFGSMQRGADNAKIGMSGLNPAVSFETGIKYNDKFLIKFGGSIESYSKSMARHEVYLGETCHMNEYTSCDYYYEDEYGDSYCGSYSTYYEESCTSDWDITNYYRSAAVAKLYAEANIKLGKNLKAFGRVEYSVFKMSEDTAPSGITHPSNEPVISSSVNKLLMYKFGLVYRF